MNEVTCKKVLVTTTSCERLQCVQKAKLVSMPQQNQNATKDRRVLLKEARNSKRKDIKYMGNGNEIKGNYRTLCLIRCILG